MMARAAVVTVAASPPPTSTGTRGEMAGGGMPRWRNAPLLQGKTLVVSIDFVLKDTGRALAMPQRYASFHSSVETATRAALTFLA